MNKTLSAILRGGWLLDKKWAESQLPVVLNAIVGNGNLSSIMTEFSALNYGEDDKPQPPKQVSSRKAANVYKVYWTTDLSSLPDGSIAMLTIAGPIMKYGDICSLGSLDYADMLNKLANASNIKGIILDVDSPGGQAVGTATLADAISSAKKKKPVVAVINDGFAASAAMWIASAADEIYTTQPTDEVGSVGVYTQIADWISYYRDKHNLRVLEIYAPQSTDKNKDYRDALAGDDTAIKADLKQLADQFISTVAKNRGGRLTSDEWKTGKMFNSKEATRIGLIDGMKSFDQIIRRMDTLIKQQSNSGNMAFEKTLATAKADAFEVTDGGFLVTEEHLNNVEAALVQAEASAARVTELEGQLATAQNAQTSAENNLQTANSRIAELEQEVASLGGSAAKPTPVTGATDKPVAGETPVVKANDMDFQKELYKQVV